MPKVKNQHLNIELHLEKKPSGITLKEYQLLYIETLYTIKHQIGSKTSKYHQEENDLYAYAQEAFGFSTDEHLRLLEKAREEKVSGRFLLFVSSENSSVV